MKQIIILIMIISSYTCYADKVYLRTGIVNSSVDDTEIIFSTGNTTLFSDSIDYDFSISPEIALGYYFDEHCSIELVANRCKADGESDVIDDIEVRNLNIGLEAKLEFPINQNIKPYISIGVGNQIFEAKIDNDKIKKDTFMGTYALGVIFKIDTLVSIYTQYKCVTTEPISSQIDVVGSLVDIEHNNEDITQFQLGWILHF